MAGSPDIMSYGRRLLPHIVDARATSGYERPFGLYPRTADPADDFWAVSYARLANAVNRVAWWLDQTLGKAGHEDHAFAYFGPTDFRYIVFVLAGMKTGHKVGDSCLFGCNSAEVAWLTDPNRLVAEYG
jgi:hypothetical protein